MKRIYMTDSKEWYKTKEQAEAYLNLFSGKYTGGIVQAEDRLLSKNLRQICKASPKRTRYIDLGPGNGEKTLFLCKALFEANKLASYVAVDIQPQFLEITKRISNKFNIPAEKVNQSFEEFLSSPQPFQQDSKLIYLGSTFGNFTKDPIERRLSNFMKKEDLVYLSAGLRPHNLDELIKSYESCLPMFYPVAKRNGLNGGNLKIIFNQDNSSIEQVYETRDTQYVLGISKKYSIQSFKEKVSKYFEGQYFTEQNHIGFLGRKI